MRINLAGGYYLEANGKNYTLREEYEGKTRDGSPRVGTRTIGHYNNATAAIQKFLEVSVLNGAQAVQIWMYAKMVEESNKTLAESLGKCIEALFEKGETNGMG